MIVRKAENQDHPVWAAMLARLHPDESEAQFESELGMLTALEQPYVGFLAFNGDRPVGMIDARVRNYAEGAPQLRAAYVEDLWVEPAHRGRGVALKLLEAVEEWARGESLAWLGSDALIDNIASHEWHRSAGFHVIERLVIFGKALR